MGFQGGTPDFETDQASLAAFMMGIAGTSGKSSQYIKMDSLENQYALYIRDRWRATPKLTFTLGLRWELYPNRRRSAGLGIESYDPTTNEALIGGRGGIPQDNGVGWSKKLFAPRVGFAWQLANNTVIRSGYGITYHSHPWGAQALRGWFPLTVVAVFNGVNAQTPPTWRMASRTRRWAPMLGFLRSLASTSTRAGFHYRMRPRRAIPLPIN